MEKEAVVADNTVLSNFALIIPNKSYAFRGFVSYKNPSDIARLFNLHEGNAFRFVNRDIPDNTVAVGVPVKALTEKKENQGI